MFVFSRETIVQIWKKHLLSNHLKIFEEFQSKDLEINNSNTKCNTKINAQKQLFNFLSPKVQVQITTKTILDACVELVTVNGRPFSMLNDTGFRKILDPILNGLQKKLYLINSHSIK